MNESARRIINSKLDSLSKSKFRSGFYLRKKEIEYINKKSYKKRLIQFIIVFIIKIMIPMKMIFSG